MKIKKPKVLIFSHKDFDSVCKAQNWNDDNVDDLKDMAFISIIGTKDCREYWMDEDNEHWFKENHSNVLNLDYDDLFSDKEYDGRLFRAMNDSQAEESVKFIENNLGKTFFIHCHAGVSRSQAYFRFITDVFYETYERDCGRKDNPCISPNISVMCKLKNAYRRINKIEEII